MFWQVLLIFVAAISVDWLTTRYTRCVVSGQRLHAALLSGIIALANLGIWSSILSNVESFGVYGAFALAGGASVGTLLGFQHRARA